MAGVDLFTPIHKTLRAMIYDSGSRLQPLDLAGPESVDTLNDVATRLAVLAQHHRHEEEFVFPPLQPHEPDIVDTLRRDHEEVEQLLTVLSGAIGRARETAGHGDGAREVGGELNRRFNELAAFYLSHLAHEELILVPATQKHFRDEELLAISGSITASISPQDRAEWLAWMLPTLNMDELSEMFVGAKISAQPQVLDGLVGIAEKHLDPERWMMVRQVAGL